MIIIHVRPLSTGSLRHLVDYWFRFGRGFWQPIYAVHVFVDVAVLAAASCHYVTLYVTLMGLGRIGCSLGLYFVSLI